MFLFWPIKLAVRLIELLVLGAIVYLVVSGVQAVEASHLPTDVAAYPKVSDAVVVGGSSSGSDWSARLEEALALYDAGRVRHLVVAASPGAPASPGGAGAAPAGAGSTDQLTAARSWLTARGVAPGDLSTLPATGAAAQLRAAGALLAGPGPVPAAARRRVLVVTDAIDALWSVKAAAEDGLAATVAPAAGSEVFVFKEPGALWREASAVAVGRVIGFGRVGWA